MSELTYVQRLRVIRDEIGRELQNTSWEQWESRAREEVSRYPKLARLLSEADEVSQTQTPAQR